MAAWPAALPQKQFVGLTETDVDAVARTPMDSGPASRRNRFSAVPRNIVVPIILNGAQKQAFDSFYRTTLSNGAQSFDWDDPVTDASISLAFTKPPQWVLTRGGTPAARHWRADLTLEILP